MNKEKFLKELENVLEIEDLTETSAIALTSLQTLAVIVFVDENYDKQLSTEKLKNIHSVTDLINLIGISF
jgi:acyl carrier protein